MPLDIDDFDAILLDLDGTVYHEEHALPGAIELIRRLQANLRKYACLTNSTSSPERIVARLKRMGVEIDPAHVYTAAAAATDYVLETFADHSGPGPNPGSDDPIGSRPRVYNLATEGVQDMLEGKVRWVGGEHERCDAIIVGVPVNVFATDERQRVAMILARKGAALVGICADRVYPSPRGLEFGVGSLTNMLAYAAAVQPVYCGKPEKFFFEELCRRLQVAPQRCVLVGDNLESDIAGARGVGMRTILTLSGVSSREDASRLPTSLRPEWFINDLTDLL